MTSSNEKNSGRQPSQSDLEGQDLEQRLQKLESEVNQPPLYYPTKHHEPERPVQQSRRQLVKWAKIMGLFVTGLVAVRVAAWLSGFVISLVMIGIAGAAAWFVYKVFFEPDSRKS
jgi:hypothetical protein